MKKRPLLCSAILAVATLISPYIACAQGHGHINAGDNNHDGYLDFDNLFAITIPSKATSGREWEAGFAYYSTGVTFTALDAQSEYPEGALGGTYVQMMLQGISGPEGANFAFFENGGSIPLFTLGSGETGGTTAYSFNLTEDSWYEGEPSSPFGHIHGRTLAFDTVGTYTLTWALFNTEAGGTLSSILNPDENLRYFTQTVTVIPEPGSVVLLGIAAGLLGMMGYRRASRAGVMFKGQ